LHADEHSHEHAQFRSASLHWLVARKLPALTGRNWPEQTPTTVGFTAARGEWPLIGSQIDDVVGACRPDRTSGRFD
jgi:hypothetical protein